jgi:sigma-B regulation protein RsbU (phosphoserine phosphatase)
MTGIYGYLQKAGNAAAFTFSRGGHPYPILYRGDAGTAEFLECKGTLLGMFPDLTYKEMSVTLKPGDRIYLYTDGIVDVPNNSGELMTFNKFLEMVQEACAHDFDETLDVVMGMVNEYRQGAIIVDDVLIIGVEVL